MVKHTKLDSSTDPPSPSLYSLWLPSPSLVHSPPAPSLSPAPHLPHRDARTSVAVATAGPAGRSGWEEGGNLHKVRNRRERDRKVDSDMKVVMLAYLIHSL